jgi:hypothetical protein
MEQPAVHPAAALYQKNRQGDEEDLGSERTSPPKRYVYPYMAQFIESLIFRDFYDFAFP